MPELKDNSVHLVVTSPPYPMIEKWDDLYLSADTLYPMELSFKSRHALLKRVWAECYRVLVPGGICCINIGDTTRTFDDEIGGKCFKCYPNYAKVVIDCLDIGFVPLIPILWKKISNRPNAFLGSGFIPTSGYISQDCEYIAILRKGGIRKFKPLDEARYASIFTKQQRDKWFQQIWEVQGVAGAGDTSAFPGEIPYRLIRMFSIKSDTVLDPFTGLGTTGAIAEQLDRKFLGYELPDRED